MTSNYMSDMIFVHSKIEPTRKWGGIILLERNCRRERTGERTWQRILPCDGKSPRLSAGAGVDGKSFEGNPQGVVCRRPKPALADGGKVRRTIYSGSETQISENCAPKLVTRHRPLSSASSYSSGVLFSSGISR